MLMTRRRRRRRQSEGRGTGVVVEIGTPAMLRGEATAEERPEEAGKEDHVDKRVWGQIETVDGKRFSRQQRKEKQERTDKATMMVGMEMAAVRQEKKTRAGSRRGGREAWKDALERLLSVS